MSHNVWLTQITLILALAQNFQRNWVFGTETIVFVIHQPYFVNGNRILGLTEKIYIGIIIDYKLITCMIPREMYMIKFLQKVNAVSVSYWNKKIARQWDLVCHHGSN